MATPARAPSADELPTIALPAYAPSVASAAVAASFDATAPSPLEDDAAQASSDGPPPLAPEASGASVPPSDPRRAVRGLGLGLPSFAEVLAQGRAVAGRLESRARQLVRDATAAAGSRAPAAEVGEPAGGARLSQGVRPRWFLPAIAAAGLAVGIGLVALVAALTRKNEVPPAASAPSPSVIAPPEASTALAAPPAEPPIAPPPPRPCVVAGAPQVVAPSALVTAGVEVRSLGEDSVAIGFAVDDHQATALRLDPTSLGAMSATRRSKLAIHRVTPTSGARGGLQATLDVDRPNDSIQGRRAVGWSSLQLGEAAGGLVWARAGGAPAGRLWDLPGDGELDALRASVATGQEQEPMVAVAFRRGGAVHVGVASGQSVLSPRGELESFAGLGGGVGSPAVAMSDGVVLAAWADRASADAPWRLRWVRFRAGERAPDPSTFSPPGGGKGDAAMSPAIAAVPGKRFLLVWTEGPAAQHELRALTLAEDGSPVGAALSLSKDDVNAGQGQAALTASGRGVVAFLESTADGFEVAATPIQCPL